MSSGPGREGLDLAELNRWCRCVAVDPARLRTALEAELRTAFETDRGHDRRVRAHIVGSAITRPDLAAAVVDIDRTLAERASAAWERAQRRGIVRTDIDPSVLASWWMAHLDSRVRIELSPTRVDGTAWNQLARTAALAAVFGSAA